MGHGIRASDTLRVLAVIVLCFLIFATGALGAEGGRKPTTAVVNTKTKININAAAIKELTTLPGIGPAKAKAKAKAVIGNRPYRRIDDIVSVRGIARKIFEKRRDRIDVE